MKIAIIGAGIYGCHLSIALANKFDVDLYDMGHELFSGASGKNSYRIHKGYHYPRSGKTREMCIKDEKMFVDKYSNLISPANKNGKVFCVANDNRTMLDYQTMKIIMDGSGLNYEDLSKQELNKLGFANVEGGFRVYESILLVDESKKWFDQELKRLNVNLKLNQKVDDIRYINDTKIGINNTEYDFVINATYNQSFEHNPVRYKHFYDLCLCLVVASKKKKSEFTSESFGVFDGAYPSLEPFGYNVVPEEYSQYQDNQMFQLFHVEHTSVQQLSNIEQARAAQKKGLSKIDLENLTEKILADTRYFYPNFDQHFDVVGHYLSLKTKVDDLSDCRPLLVKSDPSKHKRFIQVFSSKLTSIFGAEEGVKNIIDTELGINDFHVKKAVAPIQKNKTKRYEVEMA